MGNNNVEITTKSQISEEIGRLVFILALGSTFLNISIPFAATCCVYSLCFGEICSLTHLFIGLHKKEKNNFKLKQEIKNKDNYIIKEVLDISLPLTSSRIISSFTYFLEPIILTFLMLKYGFNTSYISREYGILNGYAMPLILMPAFFSGVYGKVLLPELSKLISNNKYQRSYYLFKKFMLITLLTGLSFSIFIILFRYPLLKLLYGSTIGENYILILTLPFMIYYLEAPISSALTALSLNKQTLKIGIYSAIVRLFTLVVLLEKFNIMAVAFSELCGVIVYITMGLYYVLREFSFHNIHSIFSKKSQKNIFNSHTIQIRN